MSHLSLNTRLVRVSLIHNHIVQGIGFILGVLTLTFLWVHGVHASPYRCYQETSPSQLVLTLEEASCLLRTNPRDIARLARSKQLPGRLIGGLWRFYRPSIMNWITKIVKETTRRDFDTPLESAPHNLIRSPHSSDGETSVIEKPDTHRFQLSSQSLHTTVGQGTASQKTASNERISSPSDSAQTVGEDPDLVSADDVFLRDQQVLLKPYQLTLEFGLFYSKIEQQGLSVVPLGSQLLLAFAEGEQDLVTSTYTARLGLPGDIQVFTSLPLLYQQVKLTETSAGGSVSQRSTNSLTETGDLRIGLRHTVLKEGVGYPDIILTLLGHIPTRKSSFALGGGITLVKSLDPAALFADFSYRFIFSREFTEVSRLQPRHLITSAFGYALSLNDVLALSTAIETTIIPRTTFENASLPTLPSRERFNLRLAMTALLSEGLYIEPSISFSLNGPNAITLGFSIPYTFDLPSNNPLTQ